MKNANANVKTTKRAKENDDWNNSTYCCESSKYLGSIIDDSVITCDEIINIIYSVSKIVTSAVSINFEDKRKKI